MSVISFFPKFKTSCRIQLRKKKKAVIKYPTVYKKLPVFWETFAQVKLRYVFSICKKSFLRAGSWRRLTLEGTYLEFTLYAEWEYFTDCDG